MCALFALLSAFPGYATAAACGDVKDAAGAAAAKRAEQVRDIYDAGMQNPGDIRANIADCLDLIVKTGDIFSMGVAVPDLDTVLEGLCNAANSEINQQIDAALNQAKQYGTQYTGQYSVNGDANGIAKDILGNIK
jgi:hypothetical protein